VRAIWLVVRRNCCKNPDFILVPVCVLPVSLFSDAMHSPIPSAVI
jgi:hypothetical protein